MNNFNIDRDFENKIPPLSADEFQRLEENIVADGEVREPLVIWNNTIIDGHNRWKIIQKHPEIPYKVKQMDFPDKWAAIVWMCRNQLGRRNLSEEQRAYIIKEEYEAHAKSVGGNGSNQYDKVQSEENLPIANKNQDLRHLTRSEIAKSNNMSLYQVQAAVEFGRGLDAADAVAPGIKAAVLSGETKAPKSLIAKIRNTPEENRPAAVEAIKSGDLNKAKEIIMDRPKKEIKDETLRKIVADMHDTEPVREHTADDFLEDLDMMISNFVSMMRRSFRMKAEWAKTDEEKERVLEKLDVLDAVTEELRCEIV